MYNKTNRIIVATAIGVLTFNSPVKGELQSVSFLSSNSVDVSSSEENIPFTYTASGGESFISICFRQENPTGFGRFYGETDHFYSETDSYVSHSIQVPKFTKPGKWIIEQITLYFIPRNQEASAHRVYTTYARDPSSFENPLPTGIKQLEVQVANTVTDDVPPTLISFAVDMEQLRFSYDGWLYAPCTITVEDNLSGFDSAYISFGEVSADFNSYFKVSGLTNVYEGKIYFSNPEVNKTYNFESALVKDQSGNALHISSSGQPYSDGYYQINSSPTTGTPFANLAIQLPNSFVGLPRDPAYSSGSSSEGGGASFSSTDDSSKRFKKSKKNAAKKPSKKKPGSAKKSTSKKSGPKKKPAGGKKTCGPTPEGRTMADKYRKRETHRAIVPALP